jgi:hypothetical protein
MLTGEEKEVFMPDFAGDRISAGRSPGAQATERQETEVKEHGRKH